MSIQAIAWVLQSSQARGLSRLVLISLANHANPWGASCHPSLAAIEEETKIGRASVVRAIAELVEIGEILVRSQGPGRGKVTQYVLLLGRSPEEGSSFFDEPEPEKVRPERKGPGRTFYGVAGEKVRDSTKGPGRTFYEGEKVQDGPFVDEGKGPEKVQKRSIPRASPVLGVKPLTENHTPLTPLEGGNSGAAKNPAPEYPPDFSLFADRYPPGLRNRPDAVKVWKRLDVDDELFVEIMAGLDAWVVSEQWAERKIIPGAEVWLRRRKWEETPPAPRLPSRSTRAAVVATSGSTTAADATRRRAQELRERGR